MGNCEAGDVMRVYAINITGGSCDTARQVASGYDAAAVSGANVTQAPISVAGDWSCTSTPSEIETYRVSCSKPPGTVAFYWGA